MEVFNPMAAEFVPGKVWSMPVAHDADETSTIGSPSPATMDDPLAPPGLAGLPDSAVWPGASGLLDFLMNDDDDVSKVSSLESSLKSIAAGEPLSQSLDWPTMPMSSYVDEKVFKTMSPPPGLEGDLNEQSGGSGGSGPVVPDGSEDAEGACGVPAAGGGMACRWHRSASTVGVVSEDGHVFTKIATGRQKVCVGSRGRPVELAALCMVFDESLRCGGTHSYHYRILDGEVGAADGAGFVFDSKVRRNNIQRMRSVFLNQRGCVCIRDHERVKKLGVRLPPLSTGMSLSLNIDLDSLYLQFLVFSADGNPVGMAEVSFGGFFGADSGGQLGPSGCGLAARKASEMQAPGSGFFCAVVTKEVSVGLA